MNVEQAYQVVLKCARKEAGISDEELAKEAEAKQKVADANLKAKKEYEAAKAKAEKEGNPPPEPYKPPEPEPAPPVDPKIAELREAIDLVEQHRKGLK